MQFQTDQKLIIKVDHQGIKLKYQIQNLIITFLQLKQILCEKYNLSGLNLDPLNLQCADADEFIFADDEIIKDYIKENDLIKLLINNKKILASEQEQQAQIQFLNQQLSQNQESSKYPDEVQQKNKDQESLVEEIKDQIQTMKSNPKSDPTEAIVVIYDTSGSMQGHFFDDKDISRMGAVNAFFSAFADKTIAFEYNHLVKLVCFDSTIEDKCVFTDDFEVFIQLVDDQKAKGSTKCYDALAYAVMCLQEIQLKYPQIILRIIALTDGEDNQSKSTPQEVANLIRKNQIILDSFVVGSNCGGLKQITHASGGKCYCPKTLNQAINLFEIETILSVSLRAKNEQQQAEEIDIKNFIEQPFDTEGIEVAKSEVVMKTVISPEKLIEKMNKLTEQSSTSARNNRILKELKAIVETPNPFYKVYPTNDDIGKWKILLKGPKDSQYQGGVFFLTLDIPNNYPQSAPSIRFETKIYHCNFNGSGKPCSEDSSTVSWKPEMTIDQQIVKIINLLVSPNKDNALDSTIASIMSINPTQYKMNIDEWILDHAKKTAEENLAAINGVAINKDDPIQVEQIIELQKWMDQ